MDKQFNCEYCSKTTFTSPSAYARKKHHFCSRKCYTDYRREMQPPEEQNAWMGGVSREESRRRWAEKNAKVVAARARARKQREYNAPGSHTRKEWLEVKAEYDNDCAMADSTCKGSITKDHIVPLAMGGSNDASNLQPLCRSHNSRKSTRVYIEALAKK